MYLYSLYTQNCIFKNKCIVHYINEIQFNSDTVKIHRDTPCYPGWGLSFKVGAETSTSNAPTVF